MFAGVAVLQGIDGAGVKSSQAPNLRCMTYPKPSDAATPVVSAFYDRFPFPGDPLQVLVACVGSASGRASAEDEEEVLDDEADIAEGEEGDASSEEGESEKTDDSKG